MRNVSGIIIGAEKETLLLLYNLLIRSKLDCMVYNMTKKAELK